MSRSDRSSLLLVMGTLHPRVEAALEQRFSVTFHRHPSQHVSRDLLSGVRAILIRSPFRLERETIESAPSLSMIVRAGSGLDGIDIECALERGVSVHSIPASADSVADLALALALAAARQIIPLTAETRAGVWSKGVAIGTELRGKSCLIIGFGAIGQAVSRRAAAFGMKILVNDRSPGVGTKLAVALQLAAEVVSLDVGLPRSDCIFITCSLNSTSRRLLNARTLQLVKTGCVLVNVARGAVIDEDALLAALESQRISAAALDVHEHEPPGISALITHPRVIATPHVGAQTHEAMLRIGSLAIRELRALRDRRA